MFWIHARTGPEQEVTFTLHDHLFSFFLFKIVFFKNILNECDHNIGCLDICLHTLTCRGGVPKSSIARICAPYNHYSIKVIFTRNQLNFKISVLLVRVYLT